MDGGVNTVDGGIDTADGDVDTVRFLLQHRTESLGMDAQVFHEALLGIEADAAVGTAMSCSLRIMDRVVGCSGFGIRERLVAVQAVEAEAGAGGDVGWGFLMDFKAAFFIDAVAARGAEAHDDAPGGGISGGLWLCVWCVRALHCRGSRGVVAEMTFEDLFAGEDEIALWAAITRSGAAECVRCRRRCRCRCPR